jgi:hypothetical protein
MHNVSTTEPDLSVLMPPITGSADWRPNVQLTQGRSSTDMHHTDKLIYTAQPLSCYTCMSAITYLKGVRKSLGYSLLDIQSFCTFFSRNNDDDDNDNNNNNNNRTS